MEYSSNDEAEEGENELHGRGNVNMEIAFSKDGITGHKRSLQSLLPYSDILSFNPASDVPSAPVYDTTDLVTGNDDNSEHAVPNSDPTIPLSTISSAALVVNESGTYPQTLSGTEVSSKPTESTVSSLFAGGRSQQLTTLLPGDITIPKGPMYMPTKKTRRAVASRDNPSDALNVAWEQRFAALLAYGEAHGHCNVPFHTEVPIVDEYNTETRINLGYWLSTQRQEYKKQELSPHREMMLQQLVDSGKLKWTMRSESKDDVWDYYYDRLVEYGEQNSTCNVPFQFEMSVSDDNGGAKTIKLGLWLYTQRQNWKKGKLDLRRQSKLQALVDSGKLQWEIRPLSHDDSWATKFNALLEYEKVHGHCNVPFYYEDSSMMKLGKWLDKQRQLFKIGSLAPDRLARLQALVDSGKLKWVIREQSCKESWEDTYNRMMQQLLTAAGQRAIRDGMAVNDVNRLRALLSQGPFSQNSVQQGMSSIGVEGKDIVQPDEEDATAGIPAASLEPAQSSSSSSSSSATTSASSYRAILSHSAQENSPQWLLKQTERLIQGLLPRQQAEKLHALLASGLVYNALNMKKDEDVVQHGDIGQSGEATAIVISEYLSSGTNTYTQ